METSGQLHVTVALLQTKQPPVSILYISKTGWDVEAARTIWGTEKTLDLPGIEPQVLGCTAVSRVTIPTSLSQIR